MKSFSIIQFFLFLLLVLVYQCAHGQDYVVTAKGDTLRGEVKPFIFGIDEKVQLSSDKKKTMFTVRQVKGFKHKDEIFRSVRTDKRYTFMKVLSPGYLTLYGFKPENQVHYDALYLQKIDGASLEIPNLTFKKSMSAFLEDCPDVSSRITSGELGRKSVYEIVSQYNLCVESRTQKNSQIRNQEKISAEKILSWNKLEDVVKSREFDTKTTALEMITEIKNKVNKNETVPNFMIEGLKSSLANANVQQELDNALGELKK
jgi:hypothetical protein